MDNECVVKRQYSYKRKYINDQDTGIQENVDWNYSGGSDWITTSQLSFNELSIIIQENNTESPRNSNITFIQNESGKSINKSIDQTAGVVRWVYTFYVSPTSLSFAAIGGTQSVIVLSYKEKCINDIPTGIRENVGFSSSTSASWLSSTGTSVTASENMVTSSRTAGVTYIQEEKGTVERVEITQEKAVKTNRYVISAEPYAIYDSIESTGGRRITITSQYNEYLNDKLISSKNIDWGFRETTTGSINNYLSAYSSSRKFRFTASKVNAGEGCELYYEKCTNDSGADFATFQIVQDQSSAYTVIELTITFY